MSTVTPWFAFQTEPRNEKKVQRLLIQKGYECLLPTYRQKRRWADRAITVELPLFPMYIFCRFNSAVLGKAISTSGVSRIVGFGGRPAEIPASEIEALQLLARSDLLREPWQYIPHGTVVRVETGPLAGARGTICVARGARYMSQLTSRWKNLSRPATTGTTPNMIRSKLWTEFTFS